MPEIRMNSSKSLAMNCGPLSEMIRGRASMYRSKWGSFQLRDLPDFRRVHNRLSMQHREPIDTIVAAVFKNKPRRGNLWVICPGSAGRLTEEAVKFPAGGIEGAL